MMRLAFGAMLTVLWVGLTGSVTPHNILFGAALSALALTIAHPQGDLAAYRPRPLKLLRLALLFFTELMKSSVAVAMTVISPRMDVKPGIFAFPLTVDRDFEIMLLANLITLTPGTLSVDVSDDRRTLYVHALDCADPEAARRSIAEGFERRILEALR